MTLPEGFDDGNEFYVSDVKSITEFIEELKPVLPEFSEQQIASGFRRFYNSIDSVWFYTKQQALEEAEAIKQEFIEDCRLPVDEDGVNEELTLAGEVARGTGLELIGEAKATYGYRAIDGGW